MSMNLMWKVGKSMEEFPYQTSTNLTYAVLAEDTKEAQFNLIKKDVERFMDKDRIKYVLEEIKNTLFDDDYELIMI